MRRLRRTLGMMALLCAAAPAGAAVVPAQFVVENAVPAATFVTPTSIAFLPGGRMLAAEKRGKVWSVMNGVKHPTAMIERDSEILNQGDRGLLSIAVDRRGYLYMLYTVDPDSNNSETNDDAFSRLTRYKISAADSNVVDPASRTILMGASWRTGPVSASSSHTVGDLQWGRDSTLLISSGDGAQFNQMDPGGVDPNAFGPTKTDPYEDIGAFRAQYLGSLCGKILRVNRDTGHGYASNPYYDGDLTSIRSRVWAYGVRNPYRFTVRPGTGSTDPASGNPGTLYFGDVGWSTWEDWNVVAAPGLNFGWPCYEGLGPNTNYQNASPAHHGCGTLGTPDNPALHTPPIATWHHSNPNSSSPPGSIGNAATGGVFYTGTQYPVEYRNQYFFCDYGQSWMKVGIVNASNQLTQLLDFGTSMNGPVDLATDPVSGDVHYVAIAANEVRRLRWTGPVQNTPPTAVADVTPGTGVAPLTVTFSSTGTQDLDDDPLTISWNFGDGQGSTAANPSHTYDVVGSYAAILTVDDGRGGIGRDSVGVIALITGSFPTTAVLDNFNRPNGPVGGAWTGLVNGMTIANSELTTPCCDPAAIWDGGVFGPDQEAYVTLNAVTASAYEHDLFLKAQGTTWQSGTLQVIYDAPGQQAQVWSYAPGSPWTQQGASIPVTFAAGDQLGARAYANGLVGVYKNGALVDTRPISNWPYVALGGRVGLAVWAATASRFENFGGGTFVPTGNTPPTAVVVAPLDSTFYVGGDNIALEGSATDAQQTAATMIYDWSVDLHHNTHVHPGTYVTSGQQTSFVAGDEDDGTGVWYEIVLTVTDNGGLTNVSRVAKFPEVDLEPVLLAVQPASPGTTAPAQYWFMLYNRGRMPAPYSHWRLTAGSTMLAEGDTLVPALDSALVGVTVPPLLAAGDYTLRVVADTLATVVETNEGNNGSARGLTVVEGAGVVGVPGPEAAPARLTLSLRPNPTDGRLGVELELPRAAPVELAIYDLQGRLVWREAPREFAAGRRHVAWSGRTVDGARARVGVYLMRAIVGGEVLTRRFAIVR